MNKPGEKYSDPKEHLSDAQLLGYIEGQMDNADMHTVELHLLDCDFCSDAIEGMAMLEPVEAKNAVNDLKNRLSERIEENTSERNTAIWKWAIAASVLIFFSFSAYFLFLIVGGEKAELAQKENIPYAHPIPPTDIATDTLFMEREIAMNMEKINFKEQEGKSKISQKMVYYNEVASTNQENNTEEAPPLAPKEMFDLEEKSEDIAMLNNEIEDKARYSTQEINGSIKAEEEMGKLLSGRVAGVELSKKADGFTKNKITGLVTDESGEPLPGVNVIIKGKTIGTVTDINGEYEINYNSDTTTLVFNYIGYQSKDIIVSNPKVADVAMEADMMALSEVVVVGYGTMSNKKEITENVINPKPVGGMRKFKKYIDEHISYPKETNIEGKVKVEFYVETNGSLTNFTIKKSLGPAFDQEAIRLIKEGPAWEPGKLGENKTRQSVVVKVPFKLE